MIVIKFFTDKNIDSFISPAILLLLGIFFLNKKPDEETRQISISPTAKKILIATLSISLVSGIIVMLVTIL